MFIYQRFLFQDGFGGYVEGLKEYEDGEKVTVLLGHEVSSSPQSYCTYIQGHNRKILKGVAGIFLKGRMR